MAVIPGCLKTTLTSGLATEIESVSFLCFTMR